MQSITCRRHVLGMRMLFAFVALVSAHAVTHGRLRRLHHKEKVWLHQRVGANSNGIGFGHAYNSHAYNPRLVEETASELKDVPSLIDEVPQVPQSRDFFYAQAPQSRDFGYVLPKEQPLSSRELLNYPQRPEEPQSTQTFEGVDNDPISALDLKLTEKMQIVRAERDRLRQEAMQDDALLAKLEKQEAKTATLARGPNPLARWQLEDAVERVENPTLREFQADKTGDGEAAPPSHSHIADEKPEHSVDERPHVVLKAAQSARPLDDNLRLDLAGLAAEDRTAKLLKAAKAAIEGDESMLARTNEAEDRTAGLLQAAKAAIADDERMNLADTHVPQSVRAEVVEAITGKEDSLMKRLEHLKALAKEQIDEAHSI